MSAIDEQAQSAWPDERFWCKFDGLETRHQRVQFQHENVRRDLDTLRHERSADLADAWNRYCEVIAELDRSTADLELFRSQGVS